MALNTNARRTGIVLVGKSLKCKKNSFRKICRRLATTSFLKRPYTNKEIPASRSPGARRRGLCSCGTNEAARGIGPAEICGKKNANRKNDPAPTFHWYFRR